jgi:poly(hydroxyalkanoate) granule-associated protein
MATGANEVKSKVNEAKNGAHEAVDEVAVAVNQAVERSDAATNAVVEGLRRLLLASIGAVAITADEVESFVRKLVERGELAQKDGEKLVNELTARFQRGRNQIKAEAEGVKTEASAKVEGGVESLLNRLNIPSKRDIDELSAKIAQLTARVEELRKAQAK